VTFLIRGLWISDTCAAGYSYKSSQYGLTIDTVTGCELVLPNGTVVNVTSNDEDLWFGLRVSRASSILIGIAKSSIIGRTQ
jgi:FAD/FMN-containing dehydrogenase